MNNAAARVAPETTVSDPSSRLRPLVGLNGAATMTKKPYIEKLKDPRWQKKRLEILEAAGWACEWCDDRETTLHVHHKIYLKGHEPWEYDSNQLSALCETCHSQVSDYDILADVISRTKMGGAFRREWLAHLIMGVILPEGFQYFGSKDEHYYFNLGLECRKRILAEREIDLDKT